MNYEVEKDRESEKQRNIRRKTIKMKMRRSADEHRGEKIKRKMEGREEGLVRERKGENGKEERGQSGRPSLRNVN